MHVIWLLLIPLVFVVLARKDPLDLATSKDWSDLVVVSSIYGFVAVFWPFVAVGALVVGLLYALAKISRTGID